MQKIKKAVIPAAGLGTRFYPLTRAQPKEMLPILDKPIIHYVVEEAVNSGLDEILIIVGAGKDAIINYFDSNSLDEKFNDYSFETLPSIYFVRQRKQLGLADSVRYAEKFVDSDPFVVLLGDTIYQSNTNETVTTQLIKVSERWNSTTIAVEEVTKEKISDYGVISGKEVEKDTWDIESMVEKPSPEFAPSNLGITGTYVVRDDIFSYIERINTGVNGEYQLTDALSKLSEDKRVLGYRFSGVRYDIGTKELWIRAFFDFATKDVRFKNLF